MEVERIIFFDGLGEVFFKKSKRAKRLTIRVNTANDIKVTIPAFISYNRAIEFVKEKAAWIRSTKEKLAERTGDITIFNELTEFSTLHHDLHIERIEGEVVKRKIGSGKILVSVPFTQEMTSKAVQGKIRTAILEAWRKEAKAILPGRIDELAKRNGFQYRSLNIKNMKTRWGSCTGHNGINLNLHLVRLPEHLSDYIILHELVHTIHKNHSKFFWESLEKYCKDSKAKARELKNFRLEIW
jgi:predicted metal-dependent hydrolase